MPRSAAFGESRTKKTRPFSVHMSVREREKRALSHYLLLRCNADAWNCLGCNDDRAAPAGRKALVFHKERAGLIARDDEQDDGTRNISTGTAVKSDYLVLCIVLSCTVL